MLHFPVNHDPFLSKFTGRHVKLQLILQTNSQITFSWPRDDKVMLSERFLFCVSFSLSLSLSSFSFSRPRISLKSVGKKTPMASLTRKTFEDESMTLWTFWWQWTLFQRKRRKSLGRGFRRQGIGISTRWSKRASSGACKWNGNGKHWENSLYNRSVLEI